MPVWMPIYWGDYLADTQHLTQGQHGAYMLLIAHYWQKARLPARLEQCYAIARAFDEQSRANVDFILSEFFEKTDTEYRHERIEKELQRAEEKHERLSAAGKKGATIKRQGLSQATSQATSEAGSEATSDALATTITIINNPPLPPKGEGFEQFWNAYPRKKNRGTAEKAWAKLRPDEQLRGRIMSSLSRAKTSAQWLKDGGQFIPYPATWLNAKGWEDEDTAAVSELDAYRASGRVPV